MSYLHIGWTVLKSLDSRRGAASKSRERTRLGCNRQSGSGRWHPLPLRTFLTEHYGKRRKEHARAHALPRDSTTALPLVRQNDRNGYTRV